MTNDTARDENRPNADASTSLNLKGLNSQVGKGQTFVCSPPDSDQTEYTVIMMGIQRGGTTMVAGVAQQLGLWIGENMKVNLEDPDFDRQTVGHMKAAIAKRNATHPVWGWKFPAACKYLPRIMDDLRSPRFVVVWRDPLAASMRLLERAFAEDLSPQMLRRRSLKSLETRIALQLANVTFLQSYNVPTMLISYEKAVRWPEDFITQFASFIGFEPPNDMSVLMTYMEPEKYKAAG